MRPGIVVIELARDFVALRFQQCGKRVTERRLPAMADVQRSGRVRGHELDLDLLRFLRFPAAEGGARIQDLPDDLRFRGLLQADVDEAGARDLHALDVAVLADDLAPKVSDDEFRKFARLALEMPRELHREIGCKVPVRRIPRTLEMDLRIRRFGRDFPERLLEQPRQMGFGVHERARIINREIQSNSIGSTSRCQRTPFDEEAGSAVIHWRRNSCSAGREDDCSSSCARSNPARRVITCGTGS